MSARVDWPVNGATVRILPGPQASREALERLDGAELRTAAGDRTGVRLEGESIPGGESVSEPPPLGAVQITPNGDPFVLLVDRYRTGGYAKPAVVHPDDLPIIGQLLPGMRVHFKLVEPGLRWDLGVAGALSSAGARRTCPVPVHVGRPPLCAAGAREARAAGADPRALRVGSRRALLPRRRAASRVRLRRLPATDRGCRAARRRDDRAVADQPAPAELAAGRRGRGRGRGDRARVRRGAADAGARDRGVARHALRPGRRRALPPDVPRARGDGACAAGCGAPGGSRRAAAVDPARALGRHRPGVQVHDRRAPGRPFWRAVRSGAATCCCAARRCSAC